MGLQSLVACVIVAGRMTLHTNFNRELELKCSYGDPVNFTSLPLAGNNIASTASLYLEGNVWDLSRKLFLKNVENIQ